MADKGPDNDGNWRERVDRLSSWRRDLTAEVAELPATMSDLRRTIKDLRKITERLEMATEGIEILLRHAEQSGLIDAAHRLDEAASAVQSQMATVREQTPGTEMFEATVTEIQKTLASMSELFPGWKRNPPKR